MKFLEPLRYNKMKTRLVYAILISVGIFFGAQTTIPFPYGLVVGAAGSFVVFWFWFKKPPPNSGKEVKTKWIVIGVLCVIAIVLLGSGAAPLMFSEVVYGCNLQRILATGDIEQVSEHPITKAFHEKYELDSARTSSSRSLEWGYGTVEYSYYFRDFEEGWGHAYLQSILDQCGVPQEFQFKCFDSEGAPLVLLNSKKDNVLEYLQNQNCFEMER